MSKSQVLKRERLQGVEPGHVKADRGDEVMDEIIYLVGLVVVVMAILSFFGIR